MLATGFYEFIGEVCQSMLGEVKIFGGYVEGFLRIEVGFDFWNIYQQINWKNRLIGLIGARGIGKTTLVPNCD